jgi:hypothetical protein
MNQCLSIGHLGGNTIKNNGSFVEMKLDSIDEMDKNTIILLWGVFLGEKMCCMSSFGIHTDMRQEGVPIHTSNKGGSLTFSIRRDNGKGLRG